jgi:hypothetical protein
MCKELIPLDRNCGLVLAGISKLWVAPFDNNLDWSIVNEGLIINTAITFTELELDSLSGSLLTETSFSLNGYISKVTIQTSHTKAQAGILRPLNRLLNKKLYALIQDNNGLYWFIGIEAGVKVSSLNTQSDISKGFSGHSLTLISTSTNTYNTAPVIVGGEFNNDFNFDFLS